MEVSTFANEVKRVVKDKEVTPTNDDSPAPTDGTEIFNNVAKAPEATTLAQTTTEGKAPTVEAPSAPTKIKIGTQEFESMEAAIQYANDLELATIQQEAYARGKAEAAPKAEVVVPPSIEDEISEEMFVDPKAALKKYKDAILKEMKSEITREKTEAQKQADAQALVTKTWNDFYSKNTDLSKNQEFVQFVLNKNPELLAMPAEKALDELAKRTRTYISSVRETQLPTQELQSKPVISPSSSQPTTTTKPQTTEKAIDFISQVNKIRKIKE